MAGIAWALGLSIAPTILYVLLLWWLDRYEKEPLHLLLAVFLWGAVPAIILSIILELLFDIPITMLQPAQLAYDLLGASVSAPLIEEAMKGLAILILFVTHKHEIDGPLDGLIYGAMAGLGFAAVENFFYLLGAFETGGLGGVVVLAFLRAGLFGLNHAMYTGFTGLGIALALQVRPLWLKLGLPVVGFIMAVLAHALHNTLATFWGYVPGDFPLLLAILVDWAGVLLLLVVAIWALLQERKHIRDYLTHQGARVQFAAADLPILLSPRRRWWERTRLLLTGDVRRWWVLGRYHHALTKAGFAWASWERAARWSDARAKRQAEQLLGKAEVAVLDARKRLTS